MSYSNHQDKHAYCDTQRDALARSCINSRYELDNIGYSVDIIKRSLDYSLGNYSKHYDTLVATVLQVDSLLRNAQISLEGASKQIEQIICNPPPPPENEG